MKLQTAAVLLVLMSSTGLGLSSTIQKDCGDMAPMISMSDPYSTYSNPAPPDVYENQVCVDGVDEITIGNNCNDNKAFYLYSDNTDSHISLFQGYNIPVCTGEMQVTVKQSSCSSNETALFSMSAKDNAHVAAPGIFDFNACGSYAKPDNVTIEMDVKLSDSDNVYFSGEEMTQTEITKSEQPLTVAPYIAVDGQSHFTGIVSTDFNSVTKNEGSRTKVTFDTSRSKASFIIPFTKGSHNKIDQKQTMIANNRFLNRIEPSFSYFLPKMPRVRVILDSNTTVKSQVSLAKGTHTLEIVKTGEDEVTIYEE